MLDVGGLMMDLFLQLLRANRPGDAYRLVRYLYRVGEPLIDDSTYEKFDKMVRERLPEMSDYFTRSYDDDPIPTDLLKEFGFITESSLELVEEDAVNVEELKQIFGEDKSLSIHSVTRYEEAWEFFSKHKSNGNDLFISIKVDGINTRCVYKDNVFRLALSRGRNTESTFDFTTSLAKVIPNRLSDVSSEFVPYGESYVEESYLPRLKEKYNQVNKFKTARTTALSLLRLHTYDAEDYSHLKFKAFSAPGFRDTVSETYEALEELGFSTPPHKLVHYQEIPESFEEFKHWLDKAIFTPLAEYQSEIASDGLVVEVNDYNWVGSIYGNYSTRQLALKFGPWDFSYAKGVVSGIVVQQRRVLACVKVTIEPITTQDGCEAKVINVFNPDILINAGLHIGSTVYFERNSGAVNILLRGKKLELAMSDGGE